MFYNINRIGKNITSDESLSATLISNSNNKHDNSDNVNGLLSLFVFFSIFIHQSSMIAHLNTSQTLQASYLSILVLVVVAAFFGFNCNTIYQYTYYQCDYASTGYDASLFAGIIVAGFIISIIKFSSVQRDIIDVFKSILSIDKTIIDITIITLQVFQFVLALWVSLFLNKVTNKYDRLHSINVICNTLTKYIQNCFQYDG